jgi:hypothetical protein
VEKPWKMFVLKARGNRVYSGFSLKTQSRKCAVLGFIA